MSKKKSKGAKTGQAIRFRGVYGHALGVDPNSVPDEVYASLAPPTGSNIVIVTPDSIMVAHSSECPIGGGRVDILIAEVHARGQIAIVDTERDEVRGASPAGVESERSYMSITRGTA